MEATTKQTAMTIAVAGATGRVGHHVVDVLEERGHEVVPISRDHGIDLVTGQGLAAALRGVECVVDVSSGPSPEQGPATEFFTAAMGNLQEAGRQRGVGRMIVVSIIGIDRFSGGYPAAKIAHERAALAGPVPARILRASQFHEFVGQLVDWGTQGDVAYLPKMRTQLVAARVVAEALADLATDRAAVPAPALVPIPEIAGPRPEHLIDCAELLLARRGDRRRVEGVSDPTDPDSAVYASGGLLPGPHATLAGPTFEEWLDASVPAPQRAGR
jgi:uncharacterized protein YbjT (DUF2867 family)